MTFRHDFDIFDTYLLYKDNDDGTGLFYKEGSFQIMPEFRLTKYKFSDMTAYNSVSP